MIQIENAKKFILSDVNLYIPQGTSVGIIGESGAGKTTLLKLVCGLLKPDDGRVVCLGKNPVDFRKKYGRNLSVYFTGIPLLNGEDTVKEGFEMIAYMYKMSRKEFENEYEQLSITFDFHKWDTQKIRELSLGQKARVELSAALLYHPKLLLLDEPTIGLDQEAKEKLRNTLIERVKNGMTLMMSSHDMNEVSHICDRIVMLQKGKVNFYGDERNILDKYNSLNTMKMKLTGGIPDLGDIPFQSYKIENDELTLVYSSNYITSAEILKQILQQTQVKEIVIRKADLNQIMAKDLL